MKKSAFTLIELVVAMTIFSIIMISVFFIYSNILDTSKRLEIMGNLQENARSVLESIATDVREHGIDFDHYHETMSSYTGSAIDTLAIRGGMRYYAMHAISVGGTVGCTGTDMSDTGTLADQKAQSKGLYSGCYVGLDTGTGAAVHVSNEKVVVQKLKFFISGEGARTLTSERSPGKVTVLLTLAPAPGQGIPLSMTKDSAITIQTTLSEKAYKTSPDAVSAPATMTFAPTSSCAAQPAYVYATFIAGVPTSTSQAWQNTNSSGACYYSCMSGYTGATCTAIPSPTPTPSCATRPTYTYATYTMGVPTSTNQPWQSTNPA